MLTPSSPFSSSSSPLRLVRVRTGAGESLPDLGRDALGHGVVPVDPNELAQHAPDLHLMAIDAAGILRARCSCWWRDAPSIDGHTVGTIGHYAAADSVSGGASPRAGFAAGVEAASAEVTRAEAASAETASAETTSAETTSAEAASEEAARMDAAVTDSVRDRF